MILALCITVPKIMKNKYTLQDGVVLIETTDGQQIKIDESSLPKLLCIDAYWSVVVNRQGRTREQRYARTKVKVQRVWLTRLMHRLLLNNPVNGNIDHINHDGLDNRLCNLRVVSASENIQRRRVASKNPPGLTQLPSGKWRAQVGKNYRIHHGAARLTQAEAEQDRIALIKQLYPTQIAPI